MIEVNNLTRAAIDIKIVRKITGRVLKGERKNKAEISIAFVNSAEIRKLNKKYRKKNRPTDVLSYIYDKNAGEIVICPQLVKENARKLGATFKKELAQVLIHGVLHFLGYDHEKEKYAADKMEKKQNYYLNLFAK